MTYFWPPPLRGPKISVSSRSKGSMVGCCRLGMTEVVPWVVKKEDRCLTIQDINPSTVTIRGFLQQQRNWWKKNTSTRSQYSSDNSIADFKWIADHFEGNPGLLIFPVRRRAHQWRPPGKLTIAEIWVADYALMQSRERGDSIASSFNWNTGHNGNCPDMRTCLIDCHHAEPWHGRKALLRNARSKTRSARALALALSSIWRH